MGKQKECLECVHLMNNQFEDEWLHAVEIATAYEAAFYTGNTLGLKLLGLPTKRKSSIKQSKK
jgi:hypothetical protein